MDEMNKAQESQGSHMGTGHGMCHMCGSGHRHFFLRWILGLIILAMVFALGVCVGSFHGGFDRGGYGMERHHGFMFQGDMMYQGVPMMQGASGMMQPATTSPKQ